MTGLKVAWPDRITWIVGIGTTLGMASQGAASWMVDALVKTGTLDIQQSTLMSAAEMLALGITMILLAPVIHRVPQKSVLIAGVVGLLAAQGLSSIVQGFVPMGVTRILSGVAFGAVYAVAAASGAAADNPERTYANGAVINMVLGMLLNPPLGYGSEHYGDRGVFIALAACCLVLALPLAFIAFPKAKVLSGVGPATSAATPLDWGMVIGVVLTMGLFAIATNGVFVFFVDVASRVGLGGTVLGEDLVPVSFGAAVGIALLSRLGGWLGPRLQGKSRQSRALPVLLSMAIMGAVSWLFMGVPTAWMFLILFTVWCTVYWIAYTFILGLAVAVDPLGRLAAASGSSLILFGGLGSAIAGYVSQHFGTSRYGVFAFSACVLGGLLGLWVAARLSRRAVTVSRSPSRAVVAQ